MEPFAAVRARVRTCVAVDEQVSRESRRPLEPLTALLARKAPLLTVHGAVLAETDRVTEALITRGALVRASPTTVGPTNVNLSRRFIM